MTSDPPKPVAPSGALGNVVHTIMAGAGIDLGYRKVFAIGFNKCASSSIHRVFRQVGLHATHSTEWRRAGFPFVHHWPFQAFSDGVPTDFRLLDRRFRRARFILNVRDLDEWLDSRFEHYRTGAMRKGRPFARGVPDLISWVRRRDAHHLSVLEHFEHRPGDLLVVNFIRDPDAASKISRFLGGPETMERPHVYPIPKTREQGTLKNRVMIEEAFAELGVPPPERRFDLYCPSLAEPSSLRFPSDTGAMPVADH